MQKSFHKEFHETFTTMDNFIEKIQTLMLAALAFLVGLWMYQQFGGLSSSTKHVTFAAETEQFDSGPVLKNTLGDAEFTCNSDQCSVSL